MSDWPHSAHTRTEYGLMQDRRSDGLGYCLLAVRLDLESALREAAARDAATPHWPTAVVMRTATYSAWKSARQTVKAEAPMADPREGQP